MTEGNVRSYLHSLRLISIIMAGGIMFYGTTMIILHIAKENTVQSQEFIYRYFSYFFSFVSIPISTWLFKNTIGKKTGNTLREKLIAYRSAHILRTALLEIPGLIAVTIFSISGDWIALIPAPIALIFIVLNIPSPQRIILELELDEKEASVLHAPGSRLFES